MERARYPCPSHLVTKLIEHCLIMIKTAATFLSSSFELTARSTERRRSRLNRLSERRTKPNHSADRKTWCLVLKKEEEKKKLPVESRREEIWAFMRLAMHKQRNDDSHSGVLRSVFFTATKEANLPTKMAAKHLLTMLCNLFFLLLSLTTYFCENSIQPSELSKQTN